ncbi:MAG: RNA polymerase sigma factor [Bulleidia sp.]
MSHPSEMLYIRYHREIRNYYYGLCHDASLAQDLTSDVFLEVMKSWHRFKGDSDIRTWLYAIARYRWYNHLRKKKTTVETVSLDDFLNYDFTPVSDGDEQRLKQIQDIVSGMDDRSQRLFTYRLEGYSYYEIAEKLRISENSARVLFFRIRQRIKNEILKGDV